jgi:uncharacterized protein YutD
MSLIVYKKDPKKRRVTFASDGILIGDYDIQKQHTVKMLYDECTNTCIGATGNVYVINHVLYNFSKIISTVKQFYKEELTDANTIFNEHKLSELFSEILGDAKFDFDGADFSFQSMLLVNGTDLYDITALKNLKQVEVTMIDENYYAIGYGMSYALGVLDCGGNVDKVFDVVKKRTVSINDTIKKFEFNY